MIKRLSRLLVAAPASGSGKTTAVCAILRAFVLRGIAVAALKCGPDYIDPMFHRACTGVAAGGNADLFFTDSNRMRELIAQSAGGARLALAEGAMGYYDGMGGGTQASAYEVAREAKMPVLLVVNCRGQAASVAALVKGFADFRSDSRLCGVLFNRLPARLYPALKALVERECGVRVLGFLPPMPDCALESRHLGLVTAPEVENLVGKLNRLAAQAEQTIDLEGVLRLADSAPPLVYTPLEISGQGAGARIAVARDPAFCFYYEQTLALLEELGAVLRPFSPLGDADLPEGCNGLLLGGGYPELYADRLSKNHSMLQSVRAAIGAGMPTIAECGGFLYLHRFLEDANGGRYPMAGVIDGDASKGSRLERFGYVELTARRENLLCGAGETLRGHSFHYWQSETPGDGFAAQKAGRENAWEEGHLSPSLYAGFSHLYLAGDVPAALRFVQAAAAFGERGKRNEAARADTRD